MAEKPVDPRKADEPPFAVDRRPEGEEEQKPEPEIVDDMAEEDRFQGTDN